MELTGRRILVTGAAGFIGSHLSDALAARIRCGSGSGDGELVLVDDLSVGRRENLAGLEGEEGVSIEIADIQDCVAMDRLMEGVEVVFHLAVSCLRTSLGDPFMSHDINAGGTLSVCRAAQRHGVERFVYVSSSEIYGSAKTAPMSETHPRMPTTVYGASKLAGEEYALAFWRTYAMPVVVVRPFNTYGPREPYEGARAEVIPRFILRALRGEAPVVYGDGSQTRDFTFVDDTVAGLIEAARSDSLIGDAVNVAFGHEVSIAAIAESVLRQTGSSSRSVEFVDARPGDVHRHFGDITKAKQLLDWEPGVDLEEGLARTVEWFQQQRIHEEFAGDAATPNW